MLPRGDIDLGARPRPEMRQRNSAPSRWMVTTGSGVLVGLCRVQAFLALTQPNSEVIRTPRSRSYSGAMISVNASQNAS